MKLAYTTKELAENLGFESTNKIDLLRKLGVITGIKKGNGYIFSLREIERFLEDFKGKDISNAQTIRLSMLEVLSEKQKQSLNQKEKRSPI